MRRKDGVYRWFETTFKAVRSEFTGGLLEVQSATVDIHDRKVVEECLQAQVERSQQLVDLTVALEGQTEPTEMAREALERCVRLTEFTCGYYLEIQRDSLRLLHHIGGTEELLAGLLDAYHSVTALGELGKALCANEGYHTTLNPNNLPQQLRPLLHRYRSVYGLPVTVRGELQGAFVLLSEHVHMTGESRRLLRAVAERVGAALERSLNLKQLDASREETLRALGLMLEYRDYETKGHTDRVVALGERLGRAMGFQDKELDALRWGAYLHDTGKVAIPDAVLLKPRKLDADEWALMTRHVEIGYEMLHHIPNLPPATLEVVLHHHEKWDGSGYPAGLAGPDIPLAARVFSVVDVYDALTSNRPYRAAWTKAQTLAYLREEAGRQFDPYVVEVFLRLVAGESGKHPQEECT
ncbi:MAG: HD domain-containing phosphohydrolase [Deinococcota bacterium]